MTRNEIRTLAQSLREQGYHADAGALEARTANALLQAQLWSAYKLAPESDPAERYIVATADGEQEITGIVDESDAVRIVAEHNAKAIVEQRA